MCSASRRRQAAGSPCARILATPWIWLTAPSLIGGPIPRNASWRRRQWCRPRFNLDQMQVQMQSILHVRPGMPPVRVVKAAGAGVAGRYERPFSWRSALASSTEARTAPQVVTAASP